MAYNRKSIHISLYFCEFNFRMVDYAFSSQIRRSRFRFLRTIYVFGYLNKERPDEAPGDNDNQLFLPGYLKSDSY